MRRVPPGRMMAARKAALSSDNIASDSLLICVVARWNMRPSALLPMMVFVAGENDAIASVARH